MSTDLMIPESADVPAYIRDPELAKKANEDAAAGISTGFPARVKLSGKQFTMVDGNGNETPFPANKMVTAPDGNSYFPMIVLRAKKALQKTWYATAYNPASDPTAPDCFSTDAERPDASITNPQAASCAACPQNAFGSGKDQAGNPTAGKACTDTKILAVFVPGFGIHSFKIPPASLKNFGLFVKQLSSASIPLGNVKTLVGFDVTASYPILIFQFGGYIGEELIPKLVEMSTSSEAEDVVTSTPSVALPAPVAAPEPIAVVDDLGLGLGAPAEAAPPAAAAAAVVDDLGLDAAAPAEEASPAEISDEQLMKELGL